MKENAPTLEGAKRKCATVFERKPKGLRYVTRRWHCPRYAIKGSAYCSYCQPPEERERRRRK